MLKCFPPQRVCRRKGPKLCSTHRRKGIHPRAPRATVGASLGPCFDPLPSCAGSETLYELGSAPEIRTYSFR